MDTNEIKVYIKQIIHSGGNVFERSFRDAGSVWFKKSRY